MTTPEQSWRARWKAIAKFYRWQLRQPAQVTNFCAECERIAAQPVAPPTEKEFERFIEQGKRYGQMTLDDTFDRMDADAAELAHLRTLATLAAGFCAENVGMEITENGRRLREVVGEWSRATAGDELEPGEYQRTADPDC